MINKAYAKLLYVRLIFLLKFFNSYAVIKYEGNKEFLMKIGENKEPEYKKIKINDDVEGKNKEITDNSQGSITSPNTIFNNQNNLNTDNKENISVFLNKITEELPKKISNEILIMKNDAIPEAKSYTMDPEAQEIKTIVENLREKININTRIDSPNYCTAEDIDSCLKGTYLYGKGKAIYDAAKQAGINPMSMIAIMQKETHCGLVKSAKRNNNYSGIMTKGKLKKFENFEEYIDCFAKLLRKYVDKGKASIGLVNKIYAMDKKWAKAIIEEWTNFNQKLLNKYLK